MAFINTDYIDYIRDELKEFETRDIDLLTEMIMDNLIEMNGSIPDATQEEIYNFIEGEITKENNQ